MTGAPLQWSIDTIPMAQAPSGFSFAAQPAELEALKAYAGVEALTAFTAEVKVVPLSGGKFRASGTLKANAVQASVVNLEPVPASIEESFTAEYWPAEAIGKPEDLPFDTDPPETIVAGRIPIGTFLCELFAVSIDPYPRNESDAFEWEPAEAPAAASPFASLVRLKVRNSGADKE
jgi:hypothetical protein